MSLTSGSDFSALRVNRHQQSRHPELATLEARLATFRDWPAGLEQRPAQLAEAGFFYMGTGDHVKCFCCDGALRNWEPQDEPWQEHARWFSRCNFLLTVKGPDFVSNVHSQFQNGDPWEKTPEEGGASTSSASTSSASTSSASTSSASTSSASTSSASTSSASTSSASTSSSTLVAQEEQVAETKAAEAAAAAPKQMEAKAASGQEANTSLKEALLCKICYDQNMSIVFLPCGHTLSCPSCAMALSTCPLCRNEIRATVKAFFSFA